MSEFITTKLVQKVSAFYPDLDFMSEEDVENAIIKIINLLPEKFAENLRRVRQKIGCPQKAMASAVDVSFPSYSSWENGAYLPRIDKIKAFNENLHVDIGDLIPDNPYAIIRENKIPVFNRDIFFGVRFEALDRKIRTAIPDEYITVEANKRYDFAIKIPYSEVFGTAITCIPASVIALCNFNEMKKEVNGVDDMTDEERMYFVNGKLSLISITFRDPELRECFFNGQFLNLKSYDKRKITQNFPIKMGMIDQLEDPNSALFLGYETSAKSVGILAVVKRILIDY